MFCSLAHIAELVRSENFGVYIILAFSVAEHTHATSLLSGGGNLMAISVLSFHQRGQERCIYMLYARIKSNVSELHPLVFPKHK